MGLSELPTENNRQGLPQLTNFGGFKRACAP